MSEALAPNQKDVVGPNRLTAGSPVGNRLLTVQITNYVMVGNRLSTGRSIRLSCKFKVQITNCVMWYSIRILTIRSLTIPSTHITTHLDKAKGKSITLSKRKGRPMSNLEKRKLAARDESLTSRRYSPKINNNDSGDELLTSRNPYAFYDESETSLEPYDPAHLFNTDEEKEAIPGLLDKVKIAIISITGYSKKDSNSPDNLIILDDD
ncbi:hypothetical protein F5882DRAFT_372209 [Hyaloscypha sp. PMI_1271]|nr:hypothetical protein F5882DRAFT_372209 [Hyaloscypha sp. PMI_1271]